MKRYKNLFINFFCFLKINYFISLFLNHKVFLIGYHSIGEEKNENETKRFLYKDLSLEKEKFEKQINFLIEKGHTFINFKDLNKIDLNKIKKPTIIFFDDGFKDVFLNALPILKKNNISATIFLTSSLIDGRNNLLTISLRNKLFKYGLNKTEVEDEIVKFKKLSFEEREVSLNKEDLIFIPDIFLNWDDIYKLHIAGFELGSHGVTHKKFIECKDEELRKEIKESREQIFKKCGINVDILSYPHGRFDERVVQIVKAEGIKAAVSSVEGFNSISYLRKNIFKLKKIAPKPGESLMMFEWRLYGRNIIKMLF